MQCGRLEETEKGEKDVHVAVHAEKAEAELEELLKCLAARPEPSRLPAAAPPRRLELQELCLLAHCAPWRPGSCSRLQVRPREA